MYRKRLTALGLLVVLVQTASAASPKTDVTLMWEDDATPTRFLLTVTTSGVGSPQHFQVAPSAPGACAQLPTATPQSFCTRVACPAKGTVTAYVVQADFGGTLSAPSNTVTCWIPPTATDCTCHDPATASPPQPPAPPPGVTTSPPPTLPVLTTTPPPLPQQTAAGLTLQPVGALPPVPSAPSIPATGAG